ncbi:multidrug transporter [Burkholderia pseudomallei]|nr:multidrug transporter [Burkholderia pseudomallei]OAB07566.1 multidrug transporter [Burkholderia pseudomallei]OAB16953.1 multidrug transporter [Burkholderia pseudomallei]OMQ60226.1 multidrug transporter [Burkholderia pseudomallei]OMQ74849.1 multidrug transporter [Burkholderia pseudomallei]
MGRAIGSVPIMLQKSPPSVERRAFRMGCAARVFFAFERGMRS